MLQAWADTEAWVLEPLGPEGTLTKEEESVIRKNLESRLVVSPVTGVPFIWAEQGSARCLLVIPQRPNAVEREAAELMASTLSKVTGGDFPVYTEDKINVEGDRSQGVKDSAGKNWEYVVWIGATNQAEENGITVEDLRPEGYRLESRNKDLYVLGNDHPPVRARLYKGTYFGVAAFLERHIGVRWLWPGELGNVIPHSPTLKTPALNEQDEPALRRRIIRNVALNDLSRLGLFRLQRQGQEEKYLKRVTNSQGKWLNNMRTGSSVTLQYGHAYGDWYEKYGESHPEWFAMQTDGTRTPNRKGRERLCKSNRELASQVALHVLEQFERNPNLGSISISPNDGGYNNFCMCEECRKLDPSNAPKMRYLFFSENERFYKEYPSISDRVAVFYNRIAEEVTAVNPDIVLGAYAYSYYRDAPVGVTLHPSILIGFVGLSYWDESLRQIDLKRWNRWSHRAEQLFLRPNALHGGAGLPGAYPHTLAEDIRHCYQTGMMGTDFDSLIGHWSTQGLNYYVLAKLLWDPSQDVEKLIQDYCWRGFGDAAREVFNYFTALEDATREVALLSSKDMDEGMREDEQDQEPVVYTRSEFEKRYFQVFTVGRVKALRSILEEAVYAANHDPIVLARIEFLASGLEYADLYREIRVYPRSSEPKLAMLEYLQSSFAEQPQRINSALLMWRLPFGRLTRNTDNQYSL